MSKVAFEQARLESKKYIHDSKISHHMFYGPISDLYWDAMPRVLVVGMEAVGYGDIHTVDRGMLEGWMNGKDDSGSRTVKNAMALCSGFLPVGAKYWDDGEYDFRNAFGDRDLLEAVLMSVTYMNIRSTSNSRVEQDVSEIKKVGEGEIPRLVASEIQALEPQVVLILGAATIAGLNSIREKKLSMELGDVIVDLEGTVVAAVNHTSRANYKMWQKTVDDIKSLI